MKVLAFAASGSQNSINHQLLQYVASIMTADEVELLRLSDYELPLFTAERELELGQPELAKQLFEKIGHADAVIISFAEYNGSYSAFYKNTFDWLSRIDRGVFQNKAMVLLSASPGPGGAKTVLNSALKSMPHFSADVKASLSIGKFTQVFDAHSQSIVDPEVNAQLLSALAQLSNG
ncbi:NADPH-dependent oxidoreductase [Alginatibacterium sediminis]|uniref:NADPH-dependent oxidoreductase n=1 Tax=Alginatibacterium sediminis TaxID=2164068 RepID=A0A420EDR1_9ALTE|nr:NAD(P)H-dependent oxidoreductase [Alginatibacterium sediminis]RKF18806.1 NADPH-dependent oxidoreductase [Alginatibacterium sediminis]